MKRLTEGEIRRMIRQVIKEVGHHESETSVPASWEDLLVMGQGLDDTGRADLFRSVAQRRSDLPAWVPEHAARVWGFYTLDDYRGKMYRDMLFKRAMPRKYDASKDWTSASFDSRNLDPLPGDWDPT